MHIQLQIATDSKYVDEICEQLQNFDNLGIVLQDAGDEEIYELSLETKLLWEKTKISAFFAEKTNIQAIQDIIKKSLPAQAPLYFSTQVIEDKIWEREWLKDFKPLRCGKRLWISPFGQLPEDKKAVIVWLDPGMAFGTGGHPTTRLCLEWLDSQNLEQQTVMDYGCGSGILSLAALKLGAEFVWAIDHDPQAVLATQDNTLRNDLSLEKINIVLPEALPETTQVDILLANILAKPLHELAPIFAKLLKPTGKLVLSGILEHQIPDIEKTYAQWFIETKQVIKENWGLLEFQFKL
jgi:ribosomal protein L11 methyltransferase